MRTSLWIILVSSAFYAIYVIVLYPSLISFLARRRRREPNREPITPFVSIVMAAHNGAAFLREKLDSILSLDYPRELLEIILVNDGSTDETLEIALEYEGRIRILDCPRGGKAAALNQGIKIARGEILALTDVRQPLAPDSLRLLMENFADPEVGVVSAELQIRTGSSHEEADTGAYWRYEKWIRLNLAAMDSIFGASGSYYAVRRELAIELPQNTLNDDMYLPLHAFFRGYRLIVDRRAQMYDYPTSLASEFGRKVRTLAGNYQILHHYPELLTPRNRMLVHYLSYKLGRLVLPFSLLAMVVSSLLLGSTVACFSVAIQALVYGLAICDPRISADNPLKRLSSPIRSFLVMMLATVCAISIWFLPPERLWKATKVSPARISPRELTHG